MAMNDGGPAFPCSNEQFTHGNPQTGDAWSGLSLRDYFAIHCDQPGEAEIIIAAGLKAKSSAGYMVVAVDGSEMTFAEWWRDTPQAERFRLYAKVRYAIADAMLSTRSPNP